MNPSKGDRLIVPSGCNTAAPELHFLYFPVLPVLSRTSPPKTLLSLPAKVNASPPTNSHHPSDDFHHVSSMCFSWISRFAFILISFLFIHCCFFPLILMHQLRLFVYLCLIFLRCHICHLDAATPLNHQLNK